MGSNNLPPDVTPQDIDDHYAPPNMTRAMGTVTVLADTDVPEHQSNTEAARALMSKVRDALKDHDDLEVVDGEVEERWPTDSEG